MLWSSLVVEANTKKYALKEDPWRIIGEKASCLEEVGFYYTNNRNIVYQEFIAEHM